MDFLSDLEIREINRKLDRLLKEPMMDTNKLKRIVEGYQKRKLNEPYLTKQEEEIKIIAEVMLELIDGHNKRRTIGNPEVKESG